MDCTFAYDPPDQNTRCVCTRCGHVDHDTAPVSDRHRNCGKQVVCDNLGPVTGELKDCLSCNGTRLKIFACKVHGTCTMGRNVDGHACCNPWGGEPCLDFVAKTVE